MLVQHSSLARIFLGWDLQGGQNLIFESEFLSVDSFSGNWCAFAAPFVKFQQADLNRSAHKTEGKLAESFAELSGPLVHWVQLGKICLDRDYMGWIQVGDDVEADHHQSSLAAIPYTSTENL